MRLQVFTPLKVEFCVLLPFINFCKVGSKRKLFSYCAITHGPDKKEQKNPTFLSIDFSLDDGHLDKGEVTLSNVWSPRRDWPGVKSCLKVLAVSNVLKANAALLHPALHTDVTEQLAEMQQSPL